MRDQIELTPATRDRMVEDANRAVDDHQDAGRDFRGVATHAYDSIVEKNAKEATEKVAKPIRRKTAAAKRATRKAPVRARKAKVAAAA